MFTGPEFYFFTKTESENERKKTCPHSLINELVFFFFFEQDWEKMYLTFYGQAYFDAQRQKEIYKTTI